MATENTTTAGSGNAQSIEPALNSDECLTIEELLAAERRKAIHWWTMLNELRCRGLMPDWMKGQAVGSSQDHDEHQRDCERTDAAILGCVPQFRYEIWDDGQNRLSERFTSLIEARKLQSGIRNEHPSARIVRIYGTPPEKWVSQAELVGRLRWVGDGCSGSPETVQVSIKDEKDNEASVELSDLLAEKEFLMRFDKKSLERIYSAHKWLGKPEKSL